MKSCKPIFAALLLAIGFGLPGLSANTNDVILRFLTINVWSGLNYRGYLKMGEYETAQRRELRYRSLLAQIRELQPDVVGLQEANKLPAYARRLAQDTGFCPFYHVGVGGIRLGPVGIPWNLREGDVLLARDELSPRSAGRRQLSGGLVTNWATFHFSDATQILGIKIGTRAGEIFVFVTHWHSSVSDAPRNLRYADSLRSAGLISREEYRQVLQEIEEGVRWRMQEAWKTVEFIRKTAGAAPYVLMGDFNAEPDSREIHFLLQSGMVDAFTRLHPDLPGATWDPENNQNVRLQWQRDWQGKTSLRPYERMQKFAARVPRRIDYVFVGPAELLDAGVIEIRDCHVAMQKVVDGYQASDHFGVFAEIAFRAGPRER